MGWPSVAWGLARISSAELTEWAAYSQLEPFEEDRGDLRMAILAALIANANRDEKKRKRPFTPEEFMPQFDKGDQEEEEPWRKQLALVEVMNAAFGGSDLRPGHAEGPQTP